MDVLLVGPFDLGENIGHPVLNDSMNDELKIAIEGILRIAGESKKSTGIHSTSGEQVCRPRL